MGFLHECIQAKFDLAVNYIFSIQLGQEFASLSWGKVDTHVAHRTIHVFME